MFSLFFIYTYMGLINEIIKVKTTNKNIKYFKNFDSNLNSGDIIEIEPNKLSKGSKQYVNVECENCHRINSMMYKTYLNITENDIYYCFDCKEIKTKETLQKQYNVDNVFQLESVKEKSRITSNIKYNKDYYSQTDECKERIIKTCLILYGVIHPMKNKTISCKNRKTTPESILKLKTTKTNKYKILFLLKAKNIYGDLYDYSLSNYINMNTKIKIICPIHDVFYKRPKDHIFNEQGCPYCNQSKGERKIYKYLKENDIIFEIQKRFDNCKNIRCLPFDFYLPDLNTCIEFDGELHFKSYEHFGGEEKLLKTQKNDNIKTEYCKNNDIKLLRIKYDENIINCLEQIIITNI